MYYKIQAEEIEYVGQRISLRFHEPIGCGRGGLFESMTPHEITIRCGEDGQGGIQTFPFTNVKWIEVERAMPAEKCLDFSDQCQGPVDMRWPGEGHRSWPRCEYHNEQRIKAAEDSISKYANSDLVPDWFDPDYAGERWEDDY